MQEKDVVTIEYFEDPIRFADLINGFVFHGEQRVSPEDITELNRVITKIWRKSGWLRAQMLIRDLARQVRIGVGALGWPSITKGHVRVGSITDTDSRAGGRLSHEAA